jgi:hypothetical protein
MWEIRYLNSQGKEVVCLCGYKSANESIEAVKRSDAAWSKHISARTCAGEVWFIHQGLAVQGK